MKTIALAIVAVIYLIAMGSAFDLFEREAGLRQ